jgi:phosphate butyryltransferase
VYKNFDEVEKHLIENNIQKRLVLCGAEDDSALEAVVTAKRRGLVSGLLIGDEAKIRELLEQMSEPAEDYEIVPERNGLKAGQFAVRYIHEGRADIPMKGSMASGLYLLPILDPDTGLLSEDSILSEATVFYYPDRDGLVFFGDSAYNIAPTLEDKVKIIKNLAKLARSFGSEEVKVAALSVLEDVSPDIRSSVEAHELANFDWDDGIVVEGPFALDNALDAEASRHKGIEGEVAGHADVLLMPDIHPGNVLHKSLHFLAHLPSASVLCGAEVPVVFTSRTDSVETKYLSILTAMLGA